MSVVDMEAPMTVLPQGAIPFDMVRLFVATLETVGEGGVLVLVTLVFGEGTQLETVFSFNITPLIFRWALGCKDMG